MASKDTAILCSSQHTQPPELALLKCDICVWSAVQMYCLHQVWEQLD